MEENNNGRAVDGLITGYPPNESGNIAPGIRIAGSCSGFAYPEGIAVDSSDNIYVSSYLNQPGITVLPAYQYHCVTPTAIITGAATGLQQPQGLAVDASDNIYVADPEADAVSVFPAGSNGDAAPTETIATSNTGMDSPLGVALDASGNLYVANYADPNNYGLGAVTIYPSGSNAAVTPSATISAGSTGDNTGLVYPDAVAIDSSGNIYVANSLGGDDGYGSITVYPSGSNGNASPTYTIADGPDDNDTGLNYPIALALDASNNLYVLNEAGGPDAAGSVTVYPPGSNGDVAPSATIADAANSANTDFLNPSGMALDGSANIYVTNEGSLSGGNDTVTVYPAGSNGNVSPSTTISGAATELIVPYGIAVDSHGNIYVANDGSDNGGADSLTVYPSGSNGNAAPTATISGSSTGLGQPALIALTPGS